MKNSLYELDPSLTYNYNQLQKYEIRSKIRPQVVQPLQADLDFGLLNQYKLEDLINVQSDGFRDGEVLRVAFLENHAVHLEQHAIQMFQQYAKHEIALAAIFGPKGAGKSLLLDKVLNLTEHEGSHFARIQQTVQGIYMWSIPFSRGNTKIFLMDIDGCDGDSQEYQTLLSFLFFITSSFVILSPPNDVTFQELGQMAKMIKNCRKNFLGKEEAELETIWPNHLYCLYREYNAESKALKSLRKMFARFSWRVVGDAMDQRQAQGISGQELKDVSMRKYAARKKILNEAYLRSVSSVIRHIHAKIDCKSLSSLRFTGANLVKLAVNAIQSLNVKGGLQLDRIARRSLKELYEEAYEYHTQLYDQQLAGFLAEERPFQVDYLIAAFKDSHQIVFKSFSTLTTSSELAQTYSEKLERYVAEKQRMILAINKKKCASEARMAVPANKQVQKIDDFVREVRKSPKFLEQVYADQILPIMAKALKDVQKKQNSEPKGEAAAKAESMGFKIQQKASELQQLKKKNMKKESVVKESLVKKEQLASKEKKLNQVLQKLRIQISQTKQTQPTLNHQNTLKSSQQLRIEQERLRKEMKAKQRTILQLKSQIPHTQQQIQLLNSQIQQKMIKQRELMQSAMGSKIPKLQSIQTFRSNSKISSPRKVQSRAFKSQNPQIRIISSPKV